MSQKNRKLSADKKLMAYVVGLAIGDGTLSNPNGRATCLRITCDEKYPRLMKKIAKSLSLLLPENKINVLRRRNENCSDVSVYSNHLENILGWKAGKGPKSAQNVTVPKWIINNKIYNINCLRGLIETDGSIYYDRGYKMMIFTTVIPNLAKDFYDMVVSLGFNPHIYRIKRKKNITEKSLVYHIRLSKDVNNFLKIVKPSKN